MCLALSTNSRLALVLLTLPMPASLQYVDHLFGVGKATAREAILDVYGVLQNVLVDTVLCVCDPQVVHDKLFVQAEGCPSHYTLLLIILLVPQAHLYTWFGALSYDGTEGKPGLPHNLCCHVEGYL
ncbi:hypothetical protein Y1Q_0014205 [Alligator mississippiensis]|uniref:Secreted protein n=1 Tax=Alligator mississippiensis TaxID=8496 RepID=A0A151MU51_ALLMI|nr:hypothetical protein Y1Q_0014205 [Alligator mississippiensis]